MSNQFKMISKGSTIGIITPSSPLFPGRLEAMISYFETQGYKVKIGKHNKKINRFMAGSDEERAEDIMLFFNDSDVDALIVTGGGAGSVRLLPLLDYEIIKNNPKPIVGFSDTTSLQLGIYSKTGLMSFTGFTGKDVDDVDKLDPIISDSLENCFLQRNYEMLAGETVRAGIVSAPLVGGSLMCLNYLIGSPYQPDFKNKIFFFEEVGTEPYVIDGLLSQLYLSGILDQVAGIIIGQFKGCSANYYPDRDGTVDDLIADWSQKIKVPCIKNFPYSHFNSRYVLPIGAMATLDATNCRLTVRF